VNFGIYACSFFFSKFNIGYTPHLLTPSKYHQCNSMMCVFYIAMQVILKLFFI